MATRPPGRIRNVAFLGTLFALGLTLFVQACTQREVVGVVPGSLVVTPETAEIEEGKTIQLTAIVRDQDGDVLENAIVTWSSLHPDTATVDQNGLVTGKLRGTATIRATHNGVSDEAVITVQQSAGIAVSQIGGPTTEAGGTVEFTVVLVSRPDADVTIHLASSDTTEGKVAPESLTFTPDNFDAPQTVTVTGQNDDVADGNVTYTIETDPAVSTDPRYNGLDADDRQITNNDNDTPGVVVSAVDKPTTEVGGPAQFTIVLTSQPTDPVTIELESSDVTEGDVNVSSVTFTPTTWDVKQTVIVVGKNDPEADGNIDYSIVTTAKSADATYDGIEVADVAVTNVDDETAGITVSAPSGPTREDGGQATFSVVLNARPTGNVTITIAMASTDLTEGTLSTLELVFTHEDWNVAQTVTVTGVDDDVDDGDRPYQVVLSPAVSADPNYDGLDAPDVTMTNIDDETAGVTVSPPTGPTTEAGGTASFTVVLNSQPTDDVTLTFSSSVPAEATVLTGSVTFTDANWNVPRSVIVRGENDAVADGNAAYSVVIAPATSTDPLYAGLDVPDVPMTNVDDETPGIVLSPPSGPTTEAGGTASFTVVLSTQPTAPVTIDLSSDDPSEGTVSPTTLTFNPSGSDLWSQSQTVTVTGQNDAVDDGDVVFNIVTAPATSTDANYSGMDPANVAITNIDDETAGITISPVSGPTTEAGGTATFTVVLTSEPAQPVSIQFVSADTTEGRVAIPALGTLTFNPSGPGIWNAPQQVTIAGEDDQTADGNIIYTIVTEPATSADPKYAGLNPTDVTVTNVDNERPGITVSPVNRPTTEGGETAFFTVTLNNQPTASVTIGISSSDPTEGTVSVSSLTFTTTDWNDPQLVTITGQNDFVDDDNVVYTIITTPSVSTDTNYNGINAADVTVTNVDDDTAGITVSAASGPTTEAGGQASFTIRLNSEPAADVTIGLSSNDLTEGTVSPLSVTFTQLNWNNPRLVTVTGVNDDDDDDNVVFLIVTAPANSMDQKYGGVNAADVTFTNVDDDAAGITVSPISGPTTEAGGTATFTVKLNTMPSANVNIGFSSSDPTEGQVPPGFTLTFTTSDWNNPKTVTVTGQNDAVDDGDVTYTIVTAQAISTDTRYSVINPADVTVTNIDNDQAGISVSPASGPTTEAGGTATFTVVLTSEPTQNVAIALSSSDPTEGTVTSPTPLTFTPADWSTARTITVTGVNDLVDDDNVVYTIVTEPATSTDPLYSDMNAADVTMTNIDDENAGIIVSPISGPTTEGGGMATFTVVLSTAPSDDVVIGLTSSDTSEGTVSPSSLTFRPGGSELWSDPQTVTVTGVNDPAQDGNVVYTIITAPAVSDDDGYDGLDAADISVTNVDDETAGITVSAISAPTTEDGDGATFTIVLNSQPTQDVAVGFTSSNPNEGTVNPPLVTFTTADWSSARTVTVTGVDDDVDDGNVAYQIITAPATSSDPLYNGINPADVSVTNVDDDVAGVIVSPPTGPTTEDGDIAQFTVRLASQPTGVVTIEVESSDPTEGVVTSTSQLEFDNTNWSQLQTVTVRGVDDFIDDDIVGYSITTSAASSDPLYQGIEVADVPMNNVDDTDLAGINVTPTSGLVTTEDETTAQFTVVLNSEPTADVFVTLTSSDPTEGQVTSTNPLVFTAADWDDPQTVIVTGQDDFIDDGTVPYTIQTEAATSADGKYNGRNAADVTAANQDDADMAGITVSPISGPTTEGGGTATFNIVLDSEPTANVTIVVDSDDPSEGTVAPSLLTFTAAPGSNAWNNPHTVTVTGVDDGLDDENQTYTIVTDPAQSGDPLYDEMAVDDVTVTSIDIHTASLTINDLNVAEANDAQFSVTLSVPSTRTITVGYATSNGTAVAGQDYESASGTLTFDPLETTQPIDVIVTNDTTDEPNQTFTVTLSGASNATITDGLGVATIVDDDLPPTLTIGDETVGEAADALLTVTLSAMSDQTVTVNYATSNGSATAGADYTAATGTLTFDPDETTQTIPVVVADDALDENDIETFVVTLSSPVNATFSDNSATVTITDNDPLPSLAIDDVTLTEGHSGFVNATFTVTLTPVSGRTVTVQYATSNGTATAGPASDYTTTSGTLTFSATETSKQIVVPVRGDLLDEIDETFTVTLSGETNATVSDATGVGTITDDDDPPTVSIADVTIGENANAQLAVTLSAESGKTITVQYSTADGTAVAPGDYTAAGLTTLTFDPGETTEQITVAVVNDALDENDNETFSVTLSNPSNVTIADGTATATITDNDAMPSVSIGNVTVDEDGDAQFSVTLSAPSGRTVQVQYSTANGSALAPDDYTAVGTTTLTFAPGETTQPIVVVVADDGLDEIDETFTVTLAGPSNATLGTSVGTATINDNDDPPLVSIDDETVGEAADAQFTVTLSEASGRPVQVQYSTADGTAVAPNDYTAVALTTLTFNPGVTSMPVNVVVAEDALDEDDETFTVTLSNPSDVTIDDGTGTATITDNDNPPSVSINNVTVGETADVQLTATLSAESGRTITVQYTTADGTATAPGDYTAIGTPQTVTFDPGQLTRPVDVVVNDDALDEENETFTVSLSNPSNVTINDGLGQATITDNDDPPTVSIGNVTIDEDEDAQFSVTLSAESGKTVSVQYTTTNGTAVAPGDYTAISTPQTLTFNPGVTSRQANVDVNDDAIDENSEAFTVTLSNPSNVTLGTATGTATITDNDQSTLEINDVAVGEGDAGPVNAVFTVTKTLQSSGTVQVNYATGGGTATAGTDYTSASGTVTFAPADPLTKTITILVTGDQIDEANETFNVTLSGATGGAALTDDTGVGTINDDDNAGITVSAISGATTEAAGTATFTVVLDSEPTADVSIDLSSDDTGEGQVTSSNPLVFTPGDWDDVRTVTVTGQNDDIDDGNVAYSIVTDQASSTDPLYAAIDPSDVSVTNNDDDTNGITILETGGGTSLIEATGADIVDVRLNAEPVGTVVLTITSADTGEFTVSPLTLTFDSNDWDTPKPVDLLGVSDNTPDGDQNIQLTVAVDDGLSDDAWDAVPDATVNVTVIDTD